MNSPQWSALITELLDTAGQPSGDTRRRRATDLGARAADLGVPMRDLTAAVIEAGAQYWAGLDPGRSDEARAVHGKATNLLERLTGILAAAIDGLHARARHELSTRDSERATFVHDLPTGRADPGALAERAQRYGIRLPAAHQVLVARAATLTDAAAHRIDAALAGRFGEGNTLTTLRETDLVCITAGGLRGVPAELAHVLLTELGPDRWQIGVGRRHDGVRGIVASLEEARGALDLADRLDEPTAARGRDQQGGARDRMRDNVVDDAHRQVRLVVHQKVSAALDPGAASLVGHLDIHPRA